MNVNTIKEHIKLENLSKDEWIKLCQNPLTEDFIRQWQDYIDWNGVSCMSVLSEEFIEEFKDKVNWKLICQKQKLSEYFINKFQHKCDFTTICIYQHLSQKFIDDHVPWHWNELCLHQKLSPEFIDKYFSYFYTVSLIQHQVLPEWLIKKHFKDFFKTFSWSSTTYKDKSNTFWLLTHYQQLSENFIRKYDNYFKFDVFVELENYKLSKSFILDYFEKFKERNNLILEYNNIIPNRFKKETLNIFDKIYFNLRKIKRTFQKGLLWLNSIIK